MQIIQHGHFRVPPEDTLVNNMQKRNNGIRRFTAIICIVLLMALMAGPVLGDCGCSSDSSSDSSSGSSSDSSDGSSDSRMEKAQALRDAGALLLSQGKYNESSMAFNESIALDPYSSPAWYGKGNALYYQGRFKEAEDAFEQVIVLSPSEARAWYYLGNISASTGSLQSAVKAYDRAIAIRPDYTEAKAERATALSQLKGPTSTPTPTTSLTPSPVITPARVTTALPVTETTTVPLQTAARSAVPSDTPTPKASLSPLTGLCAVSLVLLSGVLRRRRG